MFFFRIWSIWKERKYTSVQIWELHFYNPLPAQVVGRHSLQDFDTIKEAKDAAKEFFKVAYETANSGVHSIFEGKTEILYDYISVFEDSDTRVNKVLQLLESLSLGRIGSEAKINFFEEAADDPLPNENRDADADLEDESMANLALDD